MRYRKMTENQLLVYGARIRLGWFRKAEELGSVVAACRYYGVPRRTYYYWHKKWLDGDKKLYSLYDLPRTPNSHKNDVDDETVSLIIQLRLGLGYGEDKLAAIMKRDYKVIISGHGVGNVLKRAGLLQKRKKRVRKTRVRSTRSYYPGEEMQLDVKHWKRSGYQYDIIDCATRIKYKRIYTGVSPANTVDFLEHALRFFEPAFSFTGIKTDNGMEFVYDQLPQVPVGRLSPVQVWLQEHNIEHLRIPAASPHLNGRIERSHGVDKRLYKLLTTNSHSKQELRSFCHDDCLDYNFYRPHSELDNMTPIEYLQSLNGFADATVDTSVLVV